VLAQDVPGVMQAKAVDRNIDPSLTFFQVRIYVIGNGGIVSDGLNKTVTDAMRNQRVNATVYDVVSPAQVNIDVKATLTVYRQFDRDDVTGDVSQVLSNFFEMTSEESSEVKLGKNVSYSRLVAAVQGVPGVASVTFVSPNADIPVGSNEFAWLRTVDLTVSGLV
jgi:phage-related baseplate assembly protein